MSEFVTHEELKTALANERGYTKNMIEEAIEDVTNFQTAILNDVKASVRGIQLETARTAAVCDSLKERQADEFKAIKEMIAAHDGPIRRLRTYESIAVAGVNLVGGLPLWKWLRSGLAALLAVLGGAGFGFFLFIMLWG